MDPIEILHNPKRKWYKGFKQTLPTVCFKYRSWFKGTIGNRLPHENHQLVVRNCEFYFASPAELNDPFDCNMPFPFEPPADEEVFSVFLELLREDHPDWTEEQRGLEARLSVTYAPGNSTEAGRAAIASYLRENVGVLSLSGNAVEPLLWSHYADSHRGFCVGVNTRVFEIECANIIRHYQKLMQMWPMEYEAAPPQHAYLKLRRERSEMVRLLIARKSATWKVEDEIRAVVLDKTNLTINFKRHVISHVILGMNMPAEERADIINVVRASLPNATLVQAKEGPKANIDFCLI